MDNGPHASPETRPQGSRDQAENRASDGWLQSLPHHHATDAAVGRTEREAHANFGRPLSHGVGHDPVQSDHGEEQCQSRERRHE